MAAKPNTAGQSPDNTNRNLSRAAMLLGAAGLFLYIVGAKRRVRLDAEREIGFADKKEEAAD